MIRLLVVTTLYPNKAQPRHGIFVQTRLLKLLETKRFSATVVAPVPWFPFANKIFGKYAVFAKIPEVEIVKGVKVYHPRYLVLPKIGISLTPSSLAHSLKKCIRRLEKEGLAYDLVDGHYFYPDGVSISRLKAFFKKPIVITARGTDINVIAKSTVRGRWIRKAIDEIDAVVAVSKALQEKIIALGGYSGKIHVIPNGVDTKFFKCFPESELDQKDSGKLKEVLMVGNLVPEKCHQNVIEAVLDLPNIELIIAGDGYLRKNLETLGRKLGISNRLSFLGNVSQQRLVELYNQCDLLCLASEREGMPNVVLEALACGCPVVAHRVGGVPEILNEKGGILVESNDSASLGQAINQCLEKEWSRQEVSDYAKSLSWENSINALASLFERLNVEPEGISSTSAVIGRGGNE